MRILVTGGKGFIGRGLLASRWARGGEIVEWSGEVRDLAGSSDRVDAVIHLAAVTRTERFRENRHEAFAANVLGTAAVLDYCRRVGARCVFPSTSAVYAPADGGSPLAEDAPVRPVSDYALGKWLAECLCREKAREAAVPSTILRLFNVYGPGQHRSFLVPTVAECLRLGRPIRLRMPESVRDFVYIEDVVEAFGAATRIERPGVSLFNIGSGRGRRVREVVALAEKVFGRAVPIERAEPHPEESEVVVADATRAREELGWSAKWSLEAGLAALKDAAI